MPTETKTPKSTDTVTTSSEFAVIKTGGKQYVASVGDTLKIEIMKGEFKVGDSITFDKVLLVDNGSETSIGTPYINGATVTGELKEAGRSTKVTVIKYKSKSRYFKKRGHRQPYFKVEITSIS